MWENMKDLKENSPIEVMEYPVANLIVDEHTFAWWDTYCLRLMDRILAKVKSTYLKRSNTFGVEPPNTVTEAYQIDEESGIDY